MLVKFFHHGRGNSDSAVNYLLSEAPLHYLAGERDAKGVVRHPAPETVRGNPEITRHLINQLQDKKFHYTSGVLSFRELIPRKLQEEIMNRFEATAFAGLQSGQFDCCWILHQHNQRTELHFLVPRCELTTGKALNIRPPNRASEELFDTFRKIVNREFFLKDPDPAVAHLSPLEVEGLRQKLESITAARARYNNERYPAPEADLVPPILDHHEDRTRSLDGSFATFGTAARGAQPPGGDALERLSRSGRAMGAAYAQLEHASECFGRSAQAVREGAPQALAYFSQQAMNQTAMHGPPPEMMIPSPVAMRGSRSESLRPELEEMCLEMGYPQ